MKKYSKGSNLEIYNWLMQQSKLFKGLWTTPSSLLGSVLGFIVFGLVVGFKCINPINIGWLVHSKNADLLLNFLGWEFYRDSKWEFPVGVIANYGNGITSTIMHTDSIPLLAIPLKSVSAMLPMNFQYFGIWLAISFIFHGYFSWKISDKFTNNFMSKISFVLLLLFVPVMMVRTNVHVALSSQFLLLAAIYFYLEVNREYNWKWTLLLTISLLTHPYLFVMVYGVWLAYLIDSLKVSKKMKIMIWLRGTAVLGALSYVVGFFTIPANGVVTSNSWGIYRWNLASPMNPDGWSTFLQKIPRIEGNFEGFSYLGIGWIILIIISMFKLELKSIKRNLNEHRALISVAILCILFAITNKISIANFRLSYPLPTFLIEDFGIFRSSGRMIWLPLYLVFVISFILIVQKKTQRQRIGLLLSFLALIQVIDTEKGWSTLNFNQYASTKIGLDFDKKWSELAGNHTSIMVVPTGNENYMWPRVGYIASSLNLKTNCIYLARLNLIEVENQKRLIVKQLENNQLDSNFIYVLSDSQVSKFQKTLQNSNVTFTQLDGMYLLYRNS